MLKYGSYFLFFLFFTVHAYSQPEGSNLQWIIPLSKGQEPIGKPSADHLAIKENQQVFLLDINGEKRQVPYDSISHENGLFWTIWNDKLQGILHLEKGELIPPVYEHVKPLSRSATNWAFVVTKYGMTAVANEQNKLALPYQAGSYRNLQSVGDSILEYSIRRETHYISKNGLPIPPSVARLQKAPAFQRISSQQFVYERLVDGTVHKNTFAAAEPFAGNIAVVKKDSLWGYLQQDSEWLISPRFQAALPFDDLGHAVIKQKGKYGVVRRDGTFLIKPAFFFLKPFTSGLFEYKENGLTGLIDSLGKTILPAGEFGRFTAAGTECFSARSGDSLLIFRRDGDPIHLNGVTWCSDQVFDSQFLVGQQGSNENRRQKRPKKGLMSSDGTWLIPPVMTGRVTESKYFVVTEALAEPCCTIGKLNIGSNQANKFLIFDRQGEPLLTTAVDSAKPSVEGRFIIFQQGDKFGMIATQKEKLAAEYDELTSMGNGWMYAKKGELFGALKWVE